MSEKYKKKTSITCMKKGKRKKPDFPLVCTCGSNTTLKFQIEILEIERVIAEMPFFFSFFSCRSIHLTYLWNRVWYYLSIGDELGIETCIDLLLVFSALSPPNLTLIGNDDFDTNLVWKSWCCWVLVDISARSSRKKQNLRIFRVGFFFCMCNVMSGSVHPIFKS